MSHPYTVLCLACYFKGADFLRECRELGCRVLLVTSRKLAAENWPRDSVDEFFYVEDKDENWNRENLIRLVASIARDEQLDRIVPLDDYDLEKAAYLREHFRVRGLGDTRTRFFRDKLAMRERAQASGLRVPEFAHLVNRQRIELFARTVRGPWVCKPRSQASATGIKKCHSHDDLTRVVGELGDEASRYLVERFVPGDIYHVDSVIYGERVLFGRVHKYSAPPMEVAHEGGVFCTSTVSYGSQDEATLQEFNARLITSFGLRRGVAHTEFIKAHEDGQFYFLETAARVGGAHIAEMVEASSGINLWREWARIETLPFDADYHLPPIRQDHAGILISLARQEFPDTSSYDAPEVVWRVNKPHHAGLIVRSPRLERVEELLREYTDRFYEDFFASHPPADKPTA